jgi:phospholipid/cholesterol/gamma-HCH transport system substrate-binding protein
LAASSHGHRCGRVKSISLDPKTFQGVVTLDLDKNFNFPKDTSAKILTAGLLGDQYIGLEPGGDDANLAAGQTIAQTQSAVVLENLIGQFLTSKADSAATPAAGASGATK